MITCKTNILAAVIMTLSILVVPSCADKSEVNESIVFETETFKQTVGRDAVARSLLIKATNEEMP